MDMLGAYGSSGMGPGMGGIPNRRPAQGGQGRLGGGGGGGGRDRDVLTSNPDFEVLGGRGMRMGGGGGGGGGGGKGKVERGGRG